jgi:hypothetical protein
MDLDLAPDSDASLYSYRCWAERLLEK